ncbi:hypothetical protein L484_007792 [Morus notabilis]|uniref:Uncharacterized protein n=1 Tax=Morus notabilis TaxID=981085 RepID=W9REF4_9ROSA|nr:uncharacterized protein LOC21391184 [Morus notabilis]EXB86768.1 hypothetical protein L484_007792 [Morus notabilis]
MGSKIKVPIFTQTNLGTRLVVCVPSNITAGDFKRELETVHIKCFPGSGEIEVYGLMVKKKSCFYYLPNSIPVKCAFHGVRGTWFLRAEARTSSEPFCPCLLDSVSKDLDLVLSNDSIITDPLEPENSVVSIDNSNKRCEEEKYGEMELQSHKPPKKKKKRKRKSCILDYKDNGNEKKFVCAGAKPSSLTANKISDYCPFATEAEARYQQASREMTDATGDMFSEVKSVTSIINRYFPSSSEMKAHASPASSDVTSKRQSRRRKRSKTKSGDDGALSTQVDSVPKFSGRQHPSNLLPCRLPTSPSQGTSKGKIDGADVGKRLIVALDNLGISSSKTISPARLCRSRYGKGLHLNSSSLVKKAVFEISDSDD